MPHKSRGLRKISHSEIYHREFDLARNSPPPLYLRQCGEANRRRHRLTEPTTKALCQPPPPLYHPCRHCGSGCATSASNFVSTRVLATAMELLRKNKGNFAVQFCEREAGWAGVGGSSRVREKATRGAVRMPRQRRGTAECRETAPMVPRRSGPGRQPCLCPPPPPPPCP